MSWSFDELGIGASSDDILPIQSITIVVHSSNPADNRPRSKCLAVSSSWLDSGQSCSVSCIAASQSLDDLEESDLQDDYEIHLSTTLTGSLLSWLSRRIVIFFNFVVRSFVFFLASEPGLISFGRSEYSNKGNARRSTKRLRKADASHEGLFLVQPMQFVVVPNISV